MRASTKITFEDEQGRKFFGEGPARLLHGVEELGSLRAAAAAMGMAYSKALKLVQQTEQTLGFAVIVRTIGGKTGGGSRLTDEGKQWLVRYETYRDACIRENQRLYREHFPVTGCVIMASGMGVRFGGNKLMADFLGAPMFLRAIDATQGLFDRRVVVTRYEAVAQVCRERGIDVVLHDRPHRNDTISLGLNALGELDCCLFCPGDQPLLSGETVQQLLERWRGEKTHIVRPAYESTQGSPVLFPRWAFPELLSLPEGKGGGAVIGKHAQAVVTIPVDDPLELADADTPESLETLRQHAVKRGYYD